MAEGVLCVGVDEDVPSGLPADLVFRDEVTGRELLREGQAMTGGEDGYGRARDLAIEYVGELSSSLGRRVVLLEGKTQRAPCGWVFVFNTEEHVRTGNPLLGLAGNGPLLVDMAKREVVELRSSVPLKEAVAEYMEALEARHQVEQGDDRC